VIEPAIRIKFRDDWFVIESHFKTIENPVLAFTSKNGVFAFQRFLGSGKTPIKKVPVYAVGHKTAEPFEGTGIEAIVPEQEDGIGLAKKITFDFLNTPELRDATVLHFCGDKRRDEFRQFLEESDINVRDVVVYQTILQRMNLQVQQYDAILFYSPSAVQAYRNSGGFKTLPPAELFAIGYTTAEELSIESDRHVHVSPVPDTKVFLDYVARVLNDSMNQDVPLRRGKVPAFKPVPGDAQFLYYNKSLKELARKLRNNSTKSEIRLWAEVLQGKKTGYTFLRQRPVLNYIADFLCKELKLIIELDGFTHHLEQQWKKDEDRQKELEKAGFKVIRFSDEDVLKNLRNVESEIMYWINVIGDNDLSND